MDPKKVDVNVHPTKLEVRFQEESKVFKAVYHAIKETLLKADLVSDPVKDYRDVTPNDMLKEIKNKDRVEAWGLNKTFMNSVLEKQAQESKEKIEENNQNNSSDTNTNTDTSTSTDASESVESAKAKLDEIAEK